MELGKSKFPLSKLSVRSFNRGHSIRLIKPGVDFEIREGFESALLFGRAVLRGLGFDETQATKAIEDVRNRDDKRVKLELVERLEAGGPRQC